MPTPSPSPPSSRFARALRRAKSIVRVVAALCGPAVLLLWAATYFRELAICLSGGGQGEGRSSQLGWNLFTGPGYLELTYWSNEIYNSWVPKEAPRSSAMRWFIGTGPPGTKYRPSTGAPWERFGFGFVEDRPRSRPDLIRWRSFYLWVPFWFLATLSSVPTALAIRSLRRQERQARRAREGRCAQCGYDLRGSESPRCPECGVERAHV